MKAPEKNRNGLVIPPIPAKIKESTAEFYGERSKPDRHHLYFPRTEFYQRGELAHNFREHRFNSIWLPRFQHEKLHRRYDPLVRKYPSYLVPTDEVMITFLEEAHQLEELQVCVKAVEMIDDALYEGIVVNTSQTLEHRQIRMESIHEVVRKAARFEVVTPQISKLALADVHRISYEAA